MASSNPPPTEQSPSTQPTESTFVKPEVPLDTAAAVPTSKEDKQIATLKAQISQTKMKIDEANAKLIDVEKELGPVDAQATVQRHIYLLHQYNEMKDVGTGLLGLIAEKKGARIKDMYEEYGINEND